MKSKLILTLLLSAPLSAAFLSSPATASAEQLVPAGSILKCTVSDKISSKTEAIGDPVMCTLGHTEAYSRVVFPYGSYLIGHFEEYKDPGHFVGKGWMELRFDRLMIQPDTNVPINARVVAVPKYPVDAEGRIHGTGHPVRDTVEWLIPVLWPIDLINLPRRGPRPTLKPETQLTLKVLDDFGIPSQVEQDYQQPALIERRAAAIERHKETMVEQGYMTADEAFGSQYAAPQQQAPAPVQQSYAPPQPQYAPQPTYQAQAATPQIIVVQAAAPQAQPQPVYVQQPVYVPQPVYYPAALMYYVRPHYWPYY
ncbi:MAG TPA: hypothetical protein VGU25_01715 [Acidobacteriaceae bacterium]|nr:hypothetical protein [Acidobacteriaceae bacterium]